LQRQQWGRRKRRRGWKGRKKRSEGVKEGERERRP